MAQPSKFPSPFATWHDRFNKARRVQPCTTLSLHKAYTKFGARVGADRLSFKGGVVKTPFWVCCKGVQRVA
eukprot:9490436-Pyramimonas_sp.AAC.1